MYLVKKFEKSVVGVVTHITYCRGGVQGKGGRVNFILLMSSSFQVLCGGKKSLKLAKY